jgi:hypothetical protein
MSALQFDADTHTYRLNGAVVPSVTAILKPVSPDFSMVKADVLEAAADRGRAVHRMVELLESDDLDLEGLHPDLLPYLDQYMKFKATTGFQWEASEVMGGSERYGYAGTMDMLGSIGGRRLLVDIKTSAAIPKSVGPQTAAYAELIGQPKIQRAVLHLRPEKFAFTECNGTSDWAVFLACLSIHKFNTGVIR